MHFRKVTLVGVGLLGGSLGLALKRRGLADEVQGFVRRSSSVAECLALGVVDRCSRNLAEAVADADLVVLCSPVGQMATLFREMSRHLAPDCVVTDVGSVKSAPVAEIEPLAGAAGVRFVGSHPMAGAEKSGPAHARADLFDGAVCALTPTTASDPAAVDLIRRMWEAVGARVLPMNPVLHDDLVARSSHLPHVVAAGLANYVLSPAHPREQAELCAGGFRDTTRVASGSPELWRDIALANRRHLSRVLGVFIEDLSEFRLALDAGDATAVEEFFRQAKARRDQRYPDMDPHRNARADAPA
ncbi:MAG: prephenate dehydrogenase/arogenate dehydrogenase family protein [Verrucomicrobia bacterium]|nr:prephenate dehydrogenase/arogenate dehydrogenase family protein [Verrucomicrobiota bacterium]